MLALLAGRHRSLVLQNLALRQQLAMYQRTRRKPAVRWADRLFWTELRRAWSEWQSALVILRSTTVINWHRRGFAWYWTRRSSPLGGRRRVDGELRRLIREMADANLLWGAPRKAFPCDVMARFLVHARDAIVDAAFGRSVAAFGQTVVRTAPRSPWQNPYVERVIGSIRPECLDHVIVLNERHLRRLLHTYVAYYHRSRTHLALGKDAPDPRPVSAADAGPGRR